MRLPRASDSPRDPDLAAARLAGLLELIERDAAAAWWREGVRPRQADAAGIATAADELGRLRAGAAAPRPTGFLVLEAALGVPVVCAMSSDADGRGLAFGLKAAPGVAAAASGALAELMQMELALEMARHRAGRGVRSAGDRGPLARAALAPESVRRVRGLAAREPGGRAAGFTALAAALARRGHVVVIGRSCPGPLPGSRSSRSSCQVFGRSPAGHSRRWRGPRGRGAADVM